MKVWLCQASDRDTGRNRHFHAAAAAVRSAGQECAFDDVPTDGETDSVERDALVLSSHCI